MPSKQASQTRLNGLTTFSGRGNRSVGAGHCSRLAQARQPFQARCMATRSRTGIRIASLSQISGETTTVCTAAAQSDSGTVTVTAQYFLATETVAKTSPSRLCLRGRLDSFPRTAGLAALARNSRSFCWRAPGARTKTKASRNFSNQHLSQTSEAAAGRSHKTRTVLVPIRCVEAQHRRKSTHTRLRLQ